MEVTGEVMRDILLIQRVSQRLFISLSRHSLIRKRRSPLFWTWPRRNSGRGRSRQRGFMNMDVLFTGSDSALRSAEGAARAAEAAARAAMNYGK